jgi:hypothetical protein
MEKYYFVDVVVYSIIPTLVALYVTEKVKGNVKNSFDKKLEEVKKEHSLEISKFQTELNSLKAKENFKFTKLHEKRFEVLQESYKYLNKTLLRLGVYINPLKIVPLGKTSQEHNDSLNEQYTSAHNNFLEYFNHNKIFFGKDIEQLLDSYFMTSRDIYNEYFRNEFVNREGASFDTEVFTSAATAYKKIPELIEPIKIGNYSGCNIAIVLKASKIFCPFLIQVSVTERMIA